jgi:hypothetical protein
MLPIHPLLLPRKTTRRKVVRTGARMDYAAPMIATTLDVTRSTGAIAPSPGACPQSAFNSGVLDPERFRCASFCLRYARLGGGMVCAYEGECDRAAPCGDATPCADGYLCVTDACWGTPICVMPCAA